MLSTPRMEFQKGLENSGLQGVLVGDLVSAEKCSWRKGGLAYPCGEPNEILKT